MNVKSIPLLEEMLRKAGYRFADLSEVPLRDVRHVQRGAFPEMRMADLSERIALQALKRPVTRDLLCTRSGFQGPSPAHYIPRPEGSRDWIMIYCTDGKGWLRVADREFAVPAGCAFFLPAGTPHAYGASEGDPWANYWVHFRGRQAGEYLDLLGVAPASPLLYPSDGEDVVAGIERLHYLMEEVHNAANVVAASGALSALLGSVLLRQRTASRRGRTAEENCDRTLDFMRANLKNEVSLKELARVAGMSPGHYGALFRKRHQYPPMQYLNRLRIQKSCQLLRNGNLRIAEIAEEIGIPDPYYFSRIFRKIMGHAPSAYRREDSFPGKTDSGQ